MSFIISDGGGSGRGAKVSADNRLDVSSKTDERIFYVSRDEGDAFVVDSVDLGAVAGEYSLYFKNDSTSKNFFVKEITVGSAAAATFKVTTVTGTAAGGSALTPANMNLTSGNTASATVRGDGPITGLTPVILLDIASVPASGTANINFHDALILGQGDAIAVEYDIGGGSSTHVVLIGHYE